MLHATSSFLFFEIIKCSTFFDLDAPSAKAICQRAKLPVRRWKPNEGPSELARCVDKYDIVESNLMGELKNRNSLVTMGSCGTEGT